MLKFSHLIEEHRKGQFYEWGVYLVVKDTAGSTKKMFLDYFAIRPTFKEVMTIVQENQRDGSFSNEVVF